MLNGKDFATMIILNKLYWKLISLICHTLQVFLAFLISLKINLILDSFKWKERHKMIFKIQVSIIALKGLSICKIHFQNKKKLSLMLNIWSIVIILKRKTIKFLKTFLENVQEIIKMMNCKIKSKTNLSKQKPNFKYLLSYNQNYKIKRALNI